MLDALFESNNEYDIPTLRLDKQAQYLTLPFEKWGYIGREQPMPGTYHFYTDDYKFDGLWKQPDKLLKSKCAGTVECNFSTNNQMPVAVGLYRIYQKRWLARYWQSCGIPIIVDLCVSDKFVDLNLLGVPYGWRAYCTRTYSHCGTGFIDRDYQIAVNRAESTDILFVVYGGGKVIHDYCKSKNYLWLPENSRQKIYGRAYED